MVLFSKEVSRMWPATVGYHHGSCSHKGVCTQTQLAGRVRPVADEVDVEHSHAAAARLPQHGLGRRHA